MNFRFTKNYKAIVLILAVIFVIFLRIPSIFEPHWYNDEGIFANNGIQILSGAKMYLDVWDHKPPLIFLVFTVSSLLGNTLQFAKIFATIFTVLTFIAIWWQINANYGKKGFLTIVVLTTLLLNSYLFESNIVTPEIFMVSFAIFGFIFWEKQKYILSGVLFAIGGLFKPNLWFEAGMFCLVLYFVDLFSRILVQKIEENRFAKFYGLIFQDFQKYIKFIFSFLAIVIVSIIPFYIQGTFENYFQSVFRSNFDYVNITDSVLSSTLLLEFVILVLGVIGGILLKIRNTNHQNYVFFIAGLSGFLLSSRLYGHYYIEMIPPSILLLSTFVFDNIESLHVRLKQSVYFVLWGIIFGLIAFQITDERFTYVLNYDSYLKNEITYHELMNPFWKLDKGGNDVYAISEYVKSKYRGEYVYYAGNNSWFYILSETRNASPYIVYYHNWFGRKFRGLETLDKIKSNNAKAIVLWEDESLFTVLKEYVDENFVLDTDYAVDKYRLYIRK